LASGPSTETEESEEFDYGSWSTFAGVGKKRGWEGGRGGKKGTEGGRREVTYWNRISNEGHGAEVVRR
jgi:hypothetical protein